MSEIISNVNEMSGEAYERFCGRYLTQQRFTIIKYTPATDDYGADIIAKDPYGNVWAFQCKRYSDSVGKEAVQEVVAAKAHYHASRAGVITNSHLTTGAKTLAKENNVTVYENIVPDVPKNRELTIFPDEPNGAMANWALVFAILIITAPIGLWMAVSYLRKKGHARKGKAITAFAISIIAIIGMFISVINTLRSCQSTHQAESSTQISSSETATKAVEKSSKTIETARETEKETETTKPTVRYKVIVNTGRIRKGPGTDTETITLVNLNNELEGTGKSQKVGDTMWYEVFYNDSGDRGWVSEIVASPIE